MYNDCQASRCGPHVKFHDFSMTFNNWSADLKFLFFLICCFFYPSVLSFFSSGKFQKGFAVWFPLHFFTLARCGEKTRSTTTNLWNKLWKNISVYYCKVTLFYKISVIPCLSLALLVWLAPPKIVCYSRKAMGNGNPGVPMHLLKASRLKAEWRRWASTTAPW